MSLPSFYLSLSRDNLIVVRGRTTGFFVVEYPTCSSELYIAFLASLSCVSIWSSKESEEFPERYGIVPLSHQQVKGIGMPRSLRYSDGNSHVRVCVCACGWATVYVKKYPTGLTSFWLFVWYWGARSSSSRRITRSPPLLLHFTGARQHTDDMPLDLLHYLRVIAGLPMFATLVHDDPKEVSDWCIH
jgi:hypothetical protein